MIRTAFEHARFHYPDGVCARAGEKACSNVLVNRSPNTIDGGRTSNNTGREELGASKVLALLPSALENLFQVPVEKKVQPPSQTIAQQVRP